MRHNVGRGLVGLALLIAPACESNTSPGVGVTLDPTTATVTVERTTPFLAVISNSTNTAVTWSVQEGAAGGTVGPAGLYTAPLGPGTFHVVATATANPTKSATAAVTVVTVPTIGSFLATSPTVTTGTGTTLTATFSGSTASVDNGIGAVTSGVPVPTGALTSNRTYRLTVANAADTSVSAQTTVTVIGGPSITSFTAATPAIGTAGSTTLLPVFTNGVGYVNPGAIAVTSGVALATGPLTNTTTYRLVVKNVAGDSVMATQTVTVYVTPPVITAFTAGPATLTAGDSTVLSWAVNNASALAINQGVGVVTGTTRSHAPSGSTLYTLIASNPVGSDTATTSVTVYPVPSITSFTATPSALMPGNRSALRGVFTSGTGVINQSVGAVTSAVSVNTPLIQVPTTYTLTVTNPAGRAITRTATVVTDSGFFVTTWPMTTPRHLFETVMMADGRVLAVGDSPASNTAESYNAVPDTWLATLSTMTAARMQPKAVLLADGRILVTGGLGASGEYLSSAELYDPVARTFAATGSMTTPRHAHAMHLLEDGRVLVLGGSASAGPGLLSAEIYNPVTGLFTATGNIGVARQNPQLFPLSGGNILVQGGGSTFEIYNAATGTFSPTGGTTTANSIGAIRLINGDVVAIGSTRWSNGSTVPVAAPLRRRIGAQLSLLPGGEVLIVGDSGVAGAEGISETEIYNPVTNTFRLSGKAIASRGHPRINLLYTGNVVVTGGYSFEAGLEGQMFSAELYVNGYYIFAPIPIISVAAPASVGSGAAGVAISVTAISGARYVWQVTGGTVTGGRGTSAITVTAGAAGTMQIRVLVISELGMPGAASAAVTVTP